MCLQWLKAKLNQRWPSYRDTDNVGGGCRNFHAQNHAGECFYFIADYHARTTMRDAAALREHVVDVARTYLALGLDPQKATLFRQSDVPEVTELAWMLSTVTGMGLIERAHSYKDKLQNNIRPSVGLFTYPILMAADILIYDANVVPVGKDQLQHIEMTQDMATYFNQAFCPENPVLIRPEPRLSKFPYVPGIDGRKMSKSYGNTITLFMSGKQLRKRVGQIVTDSTEFGQPLPRETCTVYKFLELFYTADELEDIAGYYRTGQRDGQPFGYGHAKKVLIERMTSHFAEAHTRYQELVKNPDEVEQVLTQGAARARKLARTTIDKCKRACGLM